MQQGEGILWPQRMVKNTILSIVQAPIGSKMKIRYIFRRLRPPKGPDIRWRQTASRFKYAYYRAINKAIITFDKFGQPVLEYEM